jgi:hypothetical protein
VGQPGPDPRGEIIEDGRRARRDDRFIADVVLAMAGMLKMRTTVPQRTTGPGGGRDAQGDHSRRESAAVKRGHKVLDSLH